MEDERYTTYRMSRHVYRTHFLVPSSFGEEEDGEQYHTHFSIGKRNDDGKRHIAADTHLVEYCQESDPTSFVGTLYDRTSDLCELVLKGLPFEKIDDWTEEEKEAISMAFCPQLPPPPPPIIMSFALYPEPYEPTGFVFYHEGTLWSEIVEKEEREVIEDFPLEFEDENMCPVCREDEYNTPNCLLTLPCRHSLCKECWKGLVRSNTTYCPKCRVAIDRSLIKQKKFSSS